jgi:uncharacterized membrane protein YhaH (DUF805 family)
MTLAESVKTCLKKWRTFDGRASLSEYWWWMFALIAVLAPMYFLAAKFEFVYGLIGVTLLCLLLPSYAVAIRRLHDADKSGFLILLKFIPFIGGLVVLYFLVQPSKDPNRFDLSEQ